MDRGRSSGAKIKAHDYYWEWASVQNAELTELLDSPDYEAKENEIDPLWDNVWELMNLPKGWKAVRNTVRDKSVFMVKTDAESP